MLYNADSHWPAFSRPKDDELLSSWLLRNSHAHLLKAHTFCKVVWPDLAFWNRDIDRMALPAVWQHMAQKTGVSLERSYQTTLAAYEGLLFEKTVSRGNCTWILALGIYHRTHTHYGMQFCPSCLRQDGRQPYYRRWWRLALAVGCPQCGCQLLDECPFCKQPVVFHRNEIGHKNELASFSLSHCTNCYADLADLTSPSLPAILLAYQRQWHQRVTYTERLKSNCEYFAVLHQLLMLLASRKASLRHFQQAVAEGAGLQFRQAIGGYANRVETLRGEDRMQLTQQAVWLLEDWPGRLLQLIRQTATRLSAILSEPQHLPPSFINLLLKSGIRDV